jgi:hypothetical protein
MRSALFYAGDIAGMKLALAEGADKLSTREMKLVGASSSDLVSAKTWRLWNAMALG